MRFILFCLLFLGCPHERAYAVDCAVHPIYCSMTKLNPRVDRAHAMHLSNLLHRYSRVFNMDALDSVAIAMQENAFRDYSPKVYIVTEEGSIIAGRGDIGVFQISVATAIDYGLDPVRLMNDLEYQVAAHFRILKRKTRVCRKKGLDNQAIACYHSYTPRFRRQYYEKISAYRSQLNIRRETKDTPLSPL